MDMKPLTVEAVDCLRSKQPTCIRIYLQANKRNVGPKSRSSSRRTTEKEPGEPTVIIDQKKVKQVRQSLYICDFTDLHPFDLKRATIWLRQGLNSSKAFL